MRRNSIVLLLAAFAAALLLRLGNAPVAFTAGGIAEVSPIDELYQLKRMTYSAAHFPAVLEFDRDRGVGGAFCPWPPLYDWAAGGAARLMGATTTAAVLARVVWFPPFAFALFVALAVVWMERRFGRTAALAGGAALAASPFAVTMSWIGSIDHHWLEPIFVVAIVAAVTGVILSRGDGEGPPAHLRRGSFAPLRMTAGAMLAVALTAAMFVQTALLVAAALAFVALFLFTDGVAGAIAFSIGAAAIALFRLTRPGGYPDNAWFLGWTHAALFAAAAVACGCLALRQRRLVALLAGAAVVLATPSAPSSLLAGSLFFGGERWLRTINEFQPLWKARGEDLASFVTGLGAGAILVWPLALAAWRARDRVRGTVALFAIVYLLLTISSLRFWSVGIPLLAIAGALHAVSLSGWRRWLAIAAVAVVPPLQLALWMQNLLPPVRGAVVEWVRAAQFLQRQPPGRLLAPWSWGHLLDVVGGRAVVVDNFGTMPDQIAFERAYDAFLTTHEETLARYCAESGVRFIAFENPGALRGAAAVVGIDPAFYTGTKLAARTVWWRAYFGTAPLRRFRRVYAGRVVIVEVR